MKRSFLIAAVVLSCLCLTVEADLIVDYQGALTPTHGAFVGWDVNQDDGTTTTQRTNFTESLILTHDTYNQAQAYGGVQTINGAIDPLFRGENSYVPYAYKYLARFGGEAETGGVAGRHQAVLMWPKSLFLNGGDSATISMDATSSMTVRVVDSIFSDAGATGVHFAIKDGGTYYYSQSSITGGADTFAVTDILNEPWAVFDPLTDPANFMPSGGVFAARTFSDVQAVGLVVDTARNQYHANAQFDLLAVDAVIPEPMTLATVLGIASLMLTRRR
jgi:hypothetical protein